MASELPHGVHRARDDRIRTRRQTFVEHLISSIEPLPVTTSVARTHAEVWAGLERRGESDRSARHVDRSDRPEP